MMSQCFIRSGVRKGAGHLTSPFSVLIGPSTGTASRTLSLFLLHAGSCITRDKSRLDFRPDASVVSPQA
jgi:hypothetical protein